MRKVISIPMVYFYTFTDLHRRTFKNYSNENCPPTRLVIIETIIMHRHTGMAQHPCRGDLPPPFSPSFSPPFLPSSSARAALSRRESSVARRARRSRPGFRPRSPLPRPRELAARRRGVVVPPRGPFARIAPPGAPAPPQRFAGRGFGL